MRPLECIPTLPRFVGRRSKYEAIGASVPCQTLLSRCGGFCCTGMLIPLSQEDLLDGLRFCWPVLDMLALGDGGRCSNLDAGTGMCLVWERRPLTCRVYTCEEDDRVLPALRGEPQPTAPWRVMTAAMEKYGLSIPWAPAPERCPGCGAELLMVMGVAQKTSGRLPCVSCGTSFWIRLNGTASLDCVHLPDIPGMEGVPDWVRKQDLGHARAYCQDLEGAVEAFLGAAALAPGREESSDALRSLAVALTESASLAGLLESADYAEAREIFEERIGADPDDAERLGDLGWMLSRQGALEEAENWYARAQAAAPGSIRLAVERGLMQQDAGRAEQAFEVLRPFLAEGFHANATFTERLTEMWRGAGTELRLRMALALGESKAPRSRGILSEGASDADPRVAEACAAALELLTPFPPLVTIR